MSSRAASARKKQLRPIGNGPQPPNHQPTFHSKPNDVQIPASPPTTRSTYKPQPLPTFESSNSIWSPTGNPFPADLSRPPRRSQDKVTHLEVVQEMDPGFHPGQSSVHPAAPSNSSNLPRPEYAHPRGALPSPPHHSPLASTTFERPRPPQVSVHPQAHGFSSILGPLVSRSHSAGSSGGQQFQPNFQQERPAMPIRTLSQTALASPSRPSSSHSFPLPPSSSASSLSFKSLQGYPEDLPSSAHSYAPRGPTHFDNGPALHSAPLHGGGSPYMHPSPSHMQEQRPRNLRSVASASALSATHRNPRGMYQQRQTESFDSASVLSNSSGGLSHDNLPLSPMPRMTSGFSSSSGQGDASSVSSAGTPFVFPGGRSRAYPNGAPRFRLRGRKKKDKKRQNDGTNPDQHNTNNHPPRNGPTAPQMPKSPDSISDAWVNHNGLPSPPLSGEGVDLPSAGAQYPSESSSHFIFPGSRSSARPGADLVDATGRLALNHHHARKPSDGSGNSWQEIKRPHTRFLGLASKSKKKKEADRSPSPMVQPPFDPSGRDDSGRYSLDEASSGSNSSISGPSERDSSSAVSSRVFELNSKIGQYPLDPYDSTLLDL